MTNSLHHSGVAMERNDLSQACETDRNPVAGVLFTRALYKSGLSQQQAAIYMKLSEGQLSRQISGTNREHLSLQRLMWLPVTFWVEFLGVVAEHFGVAVQVADRRKVATANAISALATLMAVLDGDRRL